MKILPTVILGALGMNNMGNPSNPDSCFAANVDIG